MCQKIKVGVGVNECVLLETSQGVDYLLQSTGLAGCVLAIVTIDSECCFVAHALDYSGNPGKCTEQENNLLEFLNQLSTTKPTMVMVAGKMFMGQPTNNIKRIARVLKKAFPISSIKLKDCNGVQVVLNSNSSWEILSNDRDYFGGINTTDIKAKKLKVTHGTLMPSASDICVAESATN